MTNQRILLAKVKPTNFMIGINSVWKAMKFLSVLCMISALLIGCGQPNLNDPKVREKILVKAIDEDNLQTRKTPSGEELRYAPNQEQPYTGWVKDERVLQQYQNGKPNGIYISWYSNGQNSEKGTIRNGEKIGMWAFWDDNGQKKREGIYRNGIQDGLWTYWNESGQQIFKINFADIESMSAKLENPKVREIIFAEAIDSRMLEGRHSPLGEELVYAPNQKQPYTGWAKLQGSDVYFTNTDIREDILVTENVHFKEDGMPIRPFLRGLIQIRHGEIHGLVTYWYTDGQKQREGTIKNGNKDSLWTEWFENGQKRCKISYKNGDLDGILSEWYESGQKANEGNYKSGKEDGMWTYWYENGQKASEGNYKSGKEDGMWTTWNENGEEISRKTYKDGEEIP